MIDFTLAFRKTKKNKYYFFTGSVFSSKAYIVSASEKNVIVDIYESSFKKVMFIVPPSVILSFKSILLCLLFVIVMGVFVLINQRKSIKKIIGNREVVITEPLGLSKQISRKANKMKKDDFKKCLHLFLFGFGTSWLIIFDIINNKNY